MKHLLLFPFIILFLNSCESTGQQTETTTTTPASEENMATETQKSPFVDVNVEQFKKIMNEPDVVILDVRTPQETAEGKIEGAIEINIKDPSFDQKIQALDKNKTYLVYCRSGIRSVTSCNKMADEGFTNLYNLLGGYTAWSEAK